MEIPCSVLFWTLPTESNRFVGVFSANASRSSQLPVARVTLFRLIFRSLSIWIWPGAFYWFGCWSQSCAELRQGETWPKWKVPALLCLFLTNWNKVNGTMYHRCCLVNSTSLPHVLRLLDLPPAPARGSEVPQLQQCDSPSTLRPGDTGTFRAADGPCCSLLLVTDH